MPGWAAGLEPLLLATRADRLRREVRRGSRKARTALRKGCRESWSRCVPAQEEEGKGGGRIEADHPLLPALCLTEREGGSQLVCGPELTVGNRVMENDGWKVAEKSGPSPPPFSVFQGSRETLDR